MNNSYINFVIHIYTDIQTRFNSCYAILKEKKINRYKCTLLVATVRLSRFYFLSFHQNIIILIFILIM